MEGADEKARIAGYVRVDDAILLVTEVFLEHGITPFQTRLARAIACLVAMRYVRVDDSVRFKDEYTLVVGFNATFADLLGKKFLLRIDYVQDPEVSGGLPVYVNYLHPYCGEIQRHLSSLRKRLGPVLLNMTSFLLDIEKRGILWNERKTIDFILSSKSSKLSVRERNVLKMRLRNARRGFAKKAIKLKKIPIPTGHQPKFADLFLCSSSFEVRCKNVVDKMPVTGYRFGSAVVLVNDEASGTVADVHADEMISKLRSMCPPSRVSKIHCSFNQPLDVVRALDVHLKCDLDMSISGRTVIFDMTTFTTFSLLQLLKYVDRPSTLIQLMYTEAGSYNSSLSEGYDGTLPVPGFHTVKRPNKEQLLIALAGLESDRVLQARDDLAPDKTIVIFPRESADRGSVYWNDDVIEQYDVLIGMESVTVDDEYVLTTDHHRVQEKLNEIYDENSSAYDITVIPLAHKLGTLGLYLFAKDHQNVDIRCPIPSSYFTDYSVGIGSMYVATIAPESFPEGLFPESAFSF